MQHVCIYCIYMYSEIQRGTWTCIAVGTMENDQLPFNSIPISEEFPGCLSRLCVGMALVMAPNNHGRLFCFPRKHVYVMGDPRKQI